MVRVMLLWGGNRIDAFQRELRGRTSGGDSNEHIAWPESSNARNGRGKAILIGRYLRLRRSENDGRSTSALIVVARRRPTRTL